MRAKIEIYNDNDKLISKYDAPPYDERIDYFDDYEVHEYRFRFVYSEYVPKRREDKT